ncbi:hypothetical protein HRbin01_01626 [archaeon HR01]|nr:hypothetical protein HRbin01_01626 [archaeon HR01]
MKFYCDVHRKEDDSGYRITYSTDGEDFRYVDSPTEMPVGPGDRVYVDTIPIIHTDAFIELLGKGAEVYYLRRLTLMEATRQRLGIKSKSGRADVRTLMAIEDKWFKEVDENFLFMRRMISAFRTLLDTEARLNNQYDAVSEAEGQHLKRPKDSAEAEKIQLAEKIVEEAGKRFATYNKIAEELGISDDNHLMGREALAELLTYIDFTKSFVKIRDYLGLYRKRSRNEKYSHTTRQALNRLTISLMNSEPRALDEEEVLMRIWLTFRRETQERLAGIPVQQQG